jgi:putative phosphoribosyl transferase
MEFETSRVAELVEIRDGSATIAGDLTLVAAATGIVVFAHGSGSSRHSPRNKSVARKLQQSGLSTLLVDLLTSVEEDSDQQSGVSRFDVRLLADRLSAATEWLGKQPEAAALAVGYFGASTGGAAALIGAAEKAQRVQAVVSRGGRPDLAGGALRKVRAPTLLIVGGNDQHVIELNQAVLEELPAIPKRLVIVPGAIHLFEEPGTLHQVAQYAADWFLKYL